MDLSGEELSSDELKRAEELASLAYEPSAERRARIMAAVKAAPQTGSPVRQTAGSFWRFAVAAVTALAILVAGSAGAVAASGDALPSSPNYSLRWFGEQVRLTVAESATKESLRVSFATSRITQAQTVLKRGNRSDASQLLHDSRAYLSDARQDLSNVPSGERGQVENQLDQAESNQNQAEQQLNQSGEQGQR